MKGHPELDFRVPLDALTTNVDDVVNVVNAAATTSDGALTVHANWAEVGPRPT